MIVSITIRQISFKKVLILYSNDCTLHCLLLLYYDEVGCRVSMMLVTMIRKLRNSRKTSVGIIAFCLLVTAIVLQQLPSAYGAPTTYLSDNFTGTTIDTAKWVEVDTGGAGGATGNVRQNGTLTVGSSFSSPNWGINTLRSVNAFEATELEVSAVMTRASDQLLGYGDSNFTTAGTRAYIIDLTSTVLALSWSGGALQASTSCGGVTQGATYKLKVITTGFEVYKNNSLICTLAPNASHLVNNKPVFLQSSVAASTFDDVLVTGTTAAPGVPTNVITTTNTSQVGLTWTTPSAAGSTAITDYLVEYKLSSSGAWDTFADGVSTATTATVTGLINNSSYDFRISAINSIGTGTASSIVSATPSIPVAPGAPTIGLSTAGNGLAYVTFTPPSSNGGALITGYTVTASPGGATATGSGSPITVTGLTNGVSYTFTVQATNSADTSSASAQSNAVTPATGSTVLTDDFTGTTINTTKWNEVDAAGSGGTAGNIQQNGVLSISNSYVNTTWGATSLISQDSYQRTSLEISAKMTAGSNQLLGYGDYQFGTASNKAYLLYISGSSVWGVSWENGTYTITMSCGTVAVGAMYKLKVVGGGFEIYKNNTLQCLHQTSTVVSNKPVFLQSQSTASTFDDLLVNGVTVPLVAPDAPLIGTASPGNTQASITFTPPMSTGGSPVTGYTVTASPGGATATGSGSPITVTGLTNGVSYTFTVQATNAIGTSSASAASNTITPTAPSAPSQVHNLQANGVSKQVLLSWDKVIASPMTVTDYIVEYKTVAETGWHSYSDEVSASTKTVVRGLENNTAYSFRVAAVNDVGQGTFANTVDASTKPINTLSFVITGESNSGGIGLNSDASTSEVASRSSVQVMNLTSGNFLFENLDIGTNNLRDHAGLESYYANSHGLELPLANATEAKAFPDLPQVYLTKTGQGGSIISQWNVGGAYWTKFLQRTIAAKTQLPTDKQWVVWLSLGINDAIAGTPTTTWKSAMVAHLNKIKADLPGVIIIMTGFQSMTGSGGGYPTYNTVIDELAAEEAHVFAISSSGAALRDSNHWSSAGIKTVGARMVTTTKDMLGLSYPGKPTSLTAMPSAERVALSWAAPDADGGASISDYKIEYKLHSANTWSIFSDDTSLTTTAEVAGLASGSDYDFRVSAINANGVGNGAVATSTTPDTQAPIISSVAVVTTANNATISWTTDELSSSSVEYGLTADYGITTPLSDISPGTTSHTIILSSLSPCTTYHYRVISSDDGNFLSKSSHATFLTAGCSPTRIAASGTQNSMPTLDDTAQPAILDNPVVSSKSEPNNTIELAEAPSPSKGADNTALQVGIGGLVGLITAGSTYLIFRKIKPVR